MSLDSSPPLPPAVRRTAATLGVDLTEAASLRLAAYRAILAARAAPEGLMSAGAVAALDEHLIDSLSICTFIPTGVLACIDVGAGAGLPGVPVAIVRRRIRMTLLDAQARRARFLDDLSTALPELGLRVVRRRAESAAHGELREAFELALARALAPMATLVELTLPFVRPGGHLLAMKTVAAADEIEAAAHAIERSGGRLRSSHEVSWPGLRIPRLIVEVEKVHPTPAELPRRDGVPRKRPLGIRA